MIDLNVIDITFTHGFKHPTMAVISKVINLKKNDLYILNNLNLNLIKGTNK